MKTVNLNIIVPERTEMTSEEAEQQLANAIYKVAVYFYEGVGEAGMLTDNKRLHGNGHHMAQDISENAKNLWKLRLIDKK